MRALLNVGPPEDDLASRTRIVPRHTPRQQMRVQAQQVAFGKSYLISDGHDPASPSFPCQSPAEWFRPTLRNAANIGDGPVFLRMGEEISTEILDGKVERRLVRKRSQQCGPRNAFDMEPTEEGTTGNVDQGKQRDLVISRVGHFRADLDAETKLLEYADRAFMRISPTSIHKILRGPMKRIWSHRTIHSLAPKSNVKEAPGSRPAMVGPLMVAAVLVNAEVCHRATPFSKVWENHGDVTSPGYHRIRTI